MNFEDAPKARSTPTPAMVSPYSEYNGERVTESVARSTRTLLTYIAQETYPNVACLEPSVHKPSPLDSRKRRLSE